MTSYQVKLTRTIRDLPLLLAALALAACGGATSKAPPASTQNQQLSTPLAITTATLPPATFGEFYTASLQATGGSSPLNWQLQQGDLLAAGLSLNPGSGKINGIFTGGDVLKFVVEVADSQHVASKALTITAQNAPIKILTGALPPATLEHAYSVTLAVNRPRNAAVVFSLNSPADSLPPGMTLSPGGNLRGTAHSTGTFAFSVMARDAGSSSDPRQLVLKIGAAGARNDERQAATPISNGAWRASISPYADPVATANPDHDYYALSAPGGSVVQVVVNAQRLVPSSPLDSVIEILDPAGSRFSTCNQPNRTDFVDDCLNDDNDQDFTTDSMLTFKVPGSGSVHFLVHVLDYRGDARPDMVYELSVLGAD